MKGILRNLFILAAGDVASKVLGFLAVAYMARVLGPGDFGVISIAFAVLGYMTLVVSPGVHLYGTRSVASADGEDVPIIISVSVLRLALSASLLVGTLLFTFLGDEGSTLARLVLMFACSLVPLSISLDWFFQGRERMGMITGSRLILNGLYVVFLFRLVKGPDDLLWVPVSFFIGNLGASAFLSVICLRDEWSRWRAAVRDLSNFWEREKKLLVGALPLGFGSTLAQAAFHFPPLLIGFWISHEAVGQFSAAMRIVFALMILDRVASIVFYPLVSRFWNTDRRALALVSERFIRMIMIVTIPVCMMTMFLAPELIAVIYGEAYRQAVEVLRILIWFFFFTSVNTVFLFGLMGIGREGRYAKIMGAGTMAQVGSMIILLILGGLHGVAAGFVLGELIISLLAWRAYRDVVMIGLTGTFLKPAISSLLMAIALYAIPIVGLWYKVPLAIGVFLATLIVTGGIKRDDLQLLRREL